MQEQNKTLRKKNSLLVFPSVDSCLRSGVSHMANGQYDGCAHEHLRRDTSALSQMNEPISDPPKPVDLKWSPKDTTTYLKGYDVIHQC